MGNKLERGQKSLLTKCSPVGPGTELIEGEATAKQFTKPEIKEEHFAKDPTQFEIPEELKRVSEKVNSEDFKVLKVLGKGAFGKVVLVQHKEGNELYALKSLRKSKIIKLLQVEHTRSERKILEKIDHPFIVTLRYAFQTKQKLYMVLDYVCGGDLFQHLSMVEFFPEDRARFYAAEIYLALSFLHSKKIVYRDLKPENVLIDSQGHVKLTDFGLAKELQRKEQEEQERTKTFCGTDEYLAPELIVRQPYGESVDWWALGILLYEMLTGWPPWGDENRKALFDKILSDPLPLSHPNLSAEAKNLLKKMLCKKPEERIKPSNIRNHPFFLPVNFEKLLAKEIPPPFKPELKSPTDDKYFDPIVVKEDPMKDSPSTNLSKSKKGKASSINSINKIESYFKNFTYSPKSPSVNNESVEANKVK